MPDILFWNIQRLGGGRLSHGAEELKEDLEGLTSKCDPDIIVLCEGLRGLRKTMRRNHELPTGYVAPKFIKNHGNYRNHNTLRYVLMHKSHLNCQAYLIDCGGSRPALAICFNGTCVIALHAPSITNMTSRQTGQMCEAYDTVFNLIGNNQLVGAQQIALIFGDLNMDLRTAGIARRFNRNRQGRNIEQFGILDPGAGTHRNSRTRRYDTTLDWAITAPGVHATIEVVVPDPPKELEWGSDDSDDEYMPSYQNSKEPDHRPILITW